MVMVNEFFSIVVPQFSVMHINKSLFLLFPIFTGHLQVKDTQFSVTAMVYLVT